MMMMISRVIVILHFLLLIAVYCVNAETVIVSPEVVPIIPGNHNDDVVIESDSDIGSGEEDRDSSQESDYLEFEEVTPYVVTADGRFITYNIGRMMDIVQPGYSRVTRDAEEQEENIRTMPAPQEAIERVRNMASSLGSSGFNIRPPTQLNRTEYKQAADASRSQFRLQISHFTLRLIPKTYLMGKLTKIIEMTEDGGRVEHDAPELCTFTGFINSKPNTSIAISTCNGLSGLIRDEDEEYYIEPIDTKAEGNANTPRRHRLFRRSSYDNLRTKMANREEEEGKGCGMTRNDTEAEIRYVQTTGISKKIAQTIYERSKRRSGGRDRDLSGRPMYYMELSVTCDLAVQNFHGKLNLGKYLATIFNIVDEVFSHDSLPVVIKIVIRGIYLVDYHSSVSSIVADNLADTLTNICTLTKRLQDEDENRDRPFDSRIYLTRIKFQAAGYAHVAGMCDEKRSCSLSSEDGFSSAFVIAHELGHVLGMDHDGEGNSCTDKTKSIMAAMVEASLNKYTWSECSSRVLHERINSYTCLFDEPEIPKLNRVQAMFPGAMYPLDEQCRFEFGNDFTHCTPSHSQDCSELWCISPRDTSICKTKSGAPLDGTECGPHQWCFEGHCLHRTINYQEQQRIDGQWASWGPWSACSVSCGGGVRNRVRQCSNPKPAHGGRYCPGRPDQHDTKCNVKKCQVHRSLVNTTDPRAIECATSHPMNSTHKQPEWVPYEIDHFELKCLIYCQSRSTGEVVSLGYPVDDGVKCSYEDQHNICRAGRCRRMGCDGVENSNARYDACGVCRGDNSTCTHVEETIRKTINKKQHSFVKIMKIPKGARNIRIREMNAAGTVNLVALKDRLARQYFINARCCLMQNPEEHKRVISNGTMWRYSKNGENERITSTGPTHTSVLVVLYVKNSGAPINMRIQYDIKAEAVYETYPRKWSKCSAECGWGFQRARIGCRNKATGKNSPKRLCSIADKYIKKDCYSHCRWVASEWSACSQSCGNRGIKTREVQCKVYDERDYQRSVKGVSGETIHGDCVSEPSPPREVACNRYKCKMDWRTGAWSKCSVTCGNGVVRRQVACGSPRSNNDDHLCELPAPSNNKPCTLPPCVDQESVRICGETGEGPICVSNNLNRLCEAGSLGSSCCNKCRSFISNRTPGRHTRTRQTTSLMEDQSRTEFTPSHRNNEATIIQLDPPESSYTRITPPIHLRPETPLIGGVELKWGKPQVIGQSDDDQLEIFQRRVERRLEEIQNNAHNNNNSRRIPRHCVMDANGNCRRRHRRSSSRPRSRGKLRHRRIAEE